MKAKWAALVLPFCLAPATRASTFYISATGSDSNTSVQAQSKTTPWAHAPGMKNATANAGSYTPQPGDRFIFRGGDTWTVASFQWHITASGTAGSPIYYGADQTWYNASACGASFCQPIFDFQNTLVSSSCSNWNCAGIWVSANYLTLDQLTLKHFEFANNLVRSAYRGDMIHGADTGSGQTNTGYTWSKLKILDWGMEGTVGAGSDNASVGHANTITGVLLDDTGGSCGSPTTNCFTDGGVSADTITASECRNTNNCFNTGNSTISYSSIHDIKLSTDANDHENAIHAFCSATIYNNHLYNLAPGVSPILNEQLNWCPSNTSVTYYTFDNLIDETGGNQPCIVDRGGNNNTINYYHYNDTCIPSGSSGTSSYAVRAQTDSSTTCPASVHAINLHVISQGWSGSSAPITSGPGTASVNPVVSADGACTPATQITITTTVPMSPTTASSQGYTGANGYQPTAGTNATVGQGTNETALCSGSLGNLCYAFNFVDFALPGRLRLTTGKWDVGAYQFGSAPTLRPVLPPPNLVLSAH